MHGDDKSLAHVENFMSQVVKKRRKLEDSSFEEYFDYLFKDGDEGNQKMLNLLRRLKSGDNHSQPNAFVRREHARGGKQKDRIHVMKMILVNRRNVLNHDSGLSHKKR